MQQANNCCDKGNSHYNKYGWLKDTKIIVAGFGLVGGLILLYKKFDKKEKLENIKTNNKFALERQKAEIAVKTYQKKNELDVEKQRQIFAMKQGSKGAKQKIC